MSGGCTSSNDCSDYHGCKKAEIATRIGIDQRVVGHIAVAVEALAGLTRQNGIGLDESADLGVVVAGVVIVEADLVVMDLASVAVRDVIISGVGIGLIAEWGIDIFMDDVTLFAGIGLNEVGGGGKLIRFSKNSEKEYETERCHDLIR